MKFLVTVLYFCTISTCLIFFARGGDKIPTPLLWPIPYLLVALSVLVYFRSTPKEIVIGLSAYWLAPLALITIYFVVMTDIGQRNMSRMIREPLPEISIPVRGNNSQQYTQTEIP